MNPEPELIIKAKWVGDPRDGQLTDSYMHSLPYHVSKFLGKAFVDIAVVSDSLGDRFVYNGVRNLYLFPESPIRGFKIVMLDYFGDPRSIVMCELSGVTEGHTNYSKTLFTWENTLSRSTKLTLLNHCRKQFNETRKEYDTWVQQHMDTTTTVLWTHVNASFGGNRFRVITPKRSTPKPALEE